MASPTNTGIKGFAQRTWRGLVSRGMNALGPLQAMSIKRPATSTAQVMAPWLGQERRIVIDIGARWGAADAWWRIPELASLVGFEPDPVECARLNREAGPGQRFIPLALGSTRRRAPLYIAEHPGNTSLFPPIEELAVRYPHLSTGYRTLSVKEIDLVPLDDWAREDAPGNVVFMKLDTQGADLDILMGAETILATCEGLEVEVEFNALYQGQPTFAQVDQFLTKRGFRLWCLTELTHYGEDLLGGLTRWDHQNYGGLDVPCPQGSGRLFFGNAIYFRDYYQAEASAANARRVALLAALLGGLGDFAGARACLRRLIDWNAPGFADGAVSSFRSHHDELEVASRQSAETVAMARRSPLPFIPASWRAKPKSG